MRSIVLGCIVSLLLLGCGGSSKTKADAVTVELAPDVVSSQDGTLHVRATVLAGSSPLKGRTVRIGIAYADRNGNLRTFAGPTANTDRSSKARGPTGVRPRFNRRKRLFKTSSP